MKHVLFFILFSIQLCAGIGVGTSGLGALPVELSSFTANLSGSNVELQWVTAIEVGNYGFEIERQPIPNPSQREVHNRSPFGGNEGGWVKVGFILGHGNSNSPKNYSFIDTKPIHGKSKYRLKQIDNSGVFKYSKSIEINSGVLKYDLAQNYPNPFNPSTVIIYSIPNSSNVKVEVFSVLGKLVKTLVNETREAGSYKVNFDASGLCNGIYYYKIQSGNFAATKKMLLLK